MAFWQFNTAFQVWVGNKPFSSWFNAGFSSPLPTATWWNTVKTTQKKDTYTYNPRYPWFDEEDYKKLEQMVAAKGVTWDKKTEIMDQLYEIYYPQVLNKHKLNERQVEINNSIHQNGELLLNGNKEANMWIKLTSLSQQAKQKFWIPYDVPDNEVIDAMVKWTPNWSQLLYDYVNGKNQDILYEAWILDRQEETWWQKAADVAVWIAQSPWKRGYNIVWQRADKGAKELKDATEWTAVWNWLTEASTDILVWTLKKFGLSDEEIADEINAYVDERDQNYADWNAFNGREQTDIRTPLLWEERANNKYTRAWETIWDIGTAVAMTAPLWAATAPIMANSSLWWAALLWGMEWVLDTAVSQYGTQWNLNVTPGEMALGGWMWALWWMFTRYLANLPKNQSESVRKEASKYIEKSIKPTVKWKTSQAEYNKFIDDTLDVTNLMSKNKDVLQYTDDAGNVIRWELPKNMRETSETLWNFKKVIYDQYNDIAKQAWDKWARVNMNKAFNQLDDLTKDISQNISNPETKAIVDRFKNTLLEYTDDAGTIAIEDAQKITQDFNQQLTAFFKNPNMNDVSKSSIIAKLNKWTKEAIDDSIDDAFRGSITNWSKMSTQYNQLKQAYSKIKTIEDEIAKRALVEARKNAKWLSTTILDSLAWGEFTDALLTADVGKMWKAAIMKTIGKYYKYVNDPNTQLRNLFDLVERVNNPTAFQTAKSTIWNTIKSTAQKSAPKIWTITPWLAGYTANGLTNK